MFDTEQRELSFYRRLFGKMNAAIYITNLEPFTLKWVTNNELLKSVLGLNHQQVLDKGDFIASRVLSHPDFEESINTAVEAFSRNPDSTWTGAYRIKKEGSSEYSWVMYSTATFEKDEHGNPKTAVVVAFGLNEFNTPGAMQDFISHLKSRIFTTQRTSFTTQQRLVMSKILDNKTSAQIGKEMSLSKYTIDDHRKAIYKKLGCKNKSELFQYAQKIGFQK